MKGVEEMEEEEREEEEREEEEREEESRRGRGRRRSRQPNRLLFRTRRYGTTVCCDRPFEAAHSAQRGCP
jgi:hypothetical protein